MQSSKVFKTIPLICLILLASCASPRVGTEEDIIISLEKTECYGTCPVYLLQIYNNRTVTLLASKFMDIEGEYVAQVSKSRYKELINNFKSANFFEFEKSYESPVSDLPTTFIGFRDGDNYMRIKDYTGAPVELKELEKQVHALVDELNWMPVE